MTTLSHRCRPRLRPRLRPRPATPAASWPASTDRFRWVPTDAAADAPEPDDDSHAALMARVARARTAATARVWLPATDAEPAPELPFTPAPDEADEAARLFGQLDEDLDHADFDAWLEGMPIERFRQVRQALDVLRAALQEHRTDANVRDLDRWLDSAAPETADYDTMSVDDQGIRDSRSISDL